MNPKSDISVVMSVYNGERYLRESIDSIVSQCEVDIEFIIIDDGSTDSSPDILKEYAARYDVIRVISQENSGLTKALIRGCDEATGRYIARQDSDDLSLPGRLKELHELIETDERITLVSSWGQIIGPEGENLGTIERPDDPEKATRQMLEEKVGPPSHGSVMFSKEAYTRAGGYRDVFYYGQDADLWLRMVPPGSIAYVPSVLYAYRHWSDNISSVNRDLQVRYGVIGQKCRECRQSDLSEDRYLDEARQLRNHILNLKEQRNGRRSRIAATYYLIASGLEQQGDRTAVRYFRLAIKSNPLYLRAWLRLVLSLVRCRR